MLIPKANEEHDNFPCWVAVVGYSDHKERRPIIRCRCGKYMGIGRHHVHKDGRVTASFFHRDGEAENDNKGCGFHEYIELQGYTGSEWPPGQENKQLTVL